MTALSPERIAELQHWCSMPVDGRCAETLRALRDERERLLSVAEASWSMRLATDVCVSAHGTIADDLEFNRCDDAWRNALDAWKAGA